MIRRTNNIDEINSVLKHPDIWPNIADDDVDIEEFLPPIADDMHYLFSDGILFILHPEGDALQIHANVIKDKRSEAKQAANDALFYGFNVLGAESIIAKIPDKYANVVRFAELFMNKESVVDGVHNFILEKSEWVLSEA